MTKPHKVIVCGSRFFDNADMIYETLDAYRARIGPHMFLITGGAAGADSIAHRWADDRGVDHMVLYAKWDVEGKGAGPIRNKRMLKRKPKLVLAFMIDDPTANLGTKHMVRIAREAGVKAKQFVDRKSPKKIK
jgi:hypothetical protein